MIVTNGKYYLYRHIREDRNEPFYIGIGTKNEDDFNYGYYARANDKISRSDFWKSIINHTDYEIEILLESDSLDFIKQKEIEFIAFYGRRNLNKGPLCNLTDGGEGCTGYKHSEESLKIMSELKKGKPSPKKGIKLSEEQCKRMSESTKGKPSKMSEETKKKVGEQTKERWEEWRKTNTRKPDSYYRKPYVPIPDNLKFDRKTFRHTEETKQKIREKRAEQKFPEGYGEKLSEMRKGKKKPESFREFMKGKKLNPGPRDVLQLDLFGNLVRTWKSLSQVSKKLKISYCALSHACNNKRKVYNQQPNEFQGYLWKFDELNKNKLNTNN